MAKNPSRYINYFLLVAVVSVVYLLSTVSRNIEANPVGYEAQISTLDVGQGDAILVNLPGSVQILIDGGRDSRVLDPLQKRMPKFDKKIEYVIATHPDADHIGGLEPVAKSYEIGEFVETKAESQSRTYANLQNTLEKKKVKIDYADKGDRFSFAAGAKGEVLWPKEDLSNLDSNDTSIVLRLDYKGATALFTGDAELEAQNGILENFNSDEIKSELYKVPHHGSGGALNQKFLEAVSPKYAVVSVGKNNSYGHPAKTVLDALASISARVFRTDEIGTIDFVSNGTNWTKRR